MQFNKPVFLNATRQIMHIPAKRQQGEYNGCHTPMKPLRNSAEFFFVIAKSHLPFTPSVSGKFGRLFLQKSADGACRVAGAAGGALIHAFKQ